MEREHFRCCLRLEHLGLAVGKLDTGFDQSDEVSTARLMIEHD
jgi:hypothetical protein